MSFYYGEGKPRDMDPEKGCRHGLTSCTVCALEARLKRLEKALEEYHEYARKLEADRAKAWMLARGVVKQMEESMGLTEPEICTDCPITDEPGHIAHRHLPPGARG